MFDWNDLRFFLAVARTGSTLGASRQLKVSQATVSRRIAVIEEAIGIQLFVRRATGYSLTPRGALLLPLAEQAEKAIHRFAHGAEAETRRLSGVVKVTTVESAANAWVIPALAGLRECHPEIEVEVIASERYLDLSGGEADVAIRFGSRPTQGALIVRQLAELEQCFYASRELVARLGRPADYAGIAAYPLISDGNDSNSRLGKWLASNVPDARITHRNNSTSGIVATVRAGLGAAVLSCIMGDDIKDLVRLMPPIPEFLTPCWLVTTDAARRQPHIRAVIDCVVAQIETSAKRSSPQEALSA